MQTDNDKFESCYIAAIARMKLGEASHEALEEDRSRKYFEVLYQYAPTLAATSIVAASWLKNALQTNYIGPSDIAALCRCELDARRVRESERRRLLDAWHILMNDPAKEGSMAIGKVDPFEHELRVRARLAVLEWLEHRPELTEVA